MKRSNPLDIAAATGMSRATVSQTMNPCALVKEDAHKKVLKVTKDLHDKADAGVHRQRAKKIHTIAVLISADIERAQSPINPFFLPMIGSILRYAGEQGFDIITSLQQPLDDWGTDYGFSRRADGIIFLGCKDFDSYTHKFEYLNEVGDPWVIWGVNRPDCARLCIGSDNADGAYKAVCHLASLGRKRIAYFGKSSVKHPEFHERFQGYLKGLQACGLDYDPALHRDCFIEREEGATQMTRMIEAGVEFDAVFASCDLLAMGVMQALHRHGYHIPRDVSVVGFDDLWVSSSLSPSLTSLRQDTEVAARALVDGLSALIEDDPVQDIHLPTQLIVRESCGGLLPRTRLN